MSNKVNMRYMSLLGEETTFSYANMGVASRMTKKILEMHGGWFYSPERGCWVDPKSNAWLSGRVKTHTEAIRNILKEGSHILR